MLTVKRDPWASFPLQKGMQQDADLSRVIITTFPQYNLLTTNSAVVLKKRAEEQGNVMMLITYTLRQT